MPELPEVEVARRGIAPLVEGQRILGVETRTPRLRHAFPADLPRLLAGRHVAAVLRRGKYLLLRCPGEGDEGWLIVHLGMSGSLRWVHPGTAVDSHEHFDLVFADGVLRLRDPRRFGTVVWHAGENPEQHPLLAGLGIEPFDPDFSGAWLHAAFRPRRAPVKPVLMDARMLVGVGNIYASESLFRAGISPLRAANRISAARCDALAESLVATLAEAIAAGGSSVRDYVHADGGAGCFQLACAVYDRAGEPCRGCGGKVRQIRQAGRATYYCPRCQR